MKHWEAEYQGHRIRVENELFAERLIIDGVERDAGKGLATSRALRGHVPDEAGAPSQLWPS